MNRQVKEHIQEFSKAEAWKASEEVRKVEKKGPEVISWATFVQRRRRARTKRKAFHGLLSALC